MSLPRFRVRTLMIAVAVVALVICAGRLWERRVFHLAQADHSARFADFYGRWAECHRTLASQLPSSDGPATAADFAPRVERNERLRDHFRRMAAKHHDAASRPWISIEAGPPPPE
jgi:hypothetical protein